MKKLFLLFLASLLCLSFFACGDGVAPSSEAVSEADESVGNSESLSGESSAEESETSESSDPVLNDLPIEMAYNIAVGKAYTAVSEAYRTDDFGDSDDKNGKKLRGKLTDGINAPNGNSTFIAGYGSDSLTVTIDLGENNNAYVYGFSTDCYGNQWGIGDPYNTIIEYLVSDDGKSFTSCALISPCLGNAEVFEADGWSGCNYTYNLDKPITTRYIRAVYHIEGEHVWSSEINVLGFDSSFLENNGGIPRVYITTLNNDRVHRTTYYQCSIIIYDPSGEYTTITDSEGAIKIRGNSTSVGAKTPYNIKFESKENVLGMGKSKKWYLLANMYDKTQIRNKLSFDLADDIGMSYVQQSTFVEVYLNGSYRGCYQLCEAIGTGDTRVDIDPTGNEFLFEFEPWEQYSNPESFRTPIYGILLGFNDPESPSAEQLSYLQDFFTKAEEAIASHDIDKISEYLDVQSFVDAYIVQEFFKQVDYATSSTRFYIKDGKLYEGPVWDFDLSAGNCSSDYYKDYNNVYGSGNSWEGWQCLGLWNKHLFKCAEIKQMVTDRYKELQPFIINIYKDNELGKNRIDALLDEFRDDFNKNYTVWSTSDIYSELERIPSDGTYDGEIDYMRNWLKNRNEWILEQYGLN
ncbi:MAG: CotH kinase family protein [Eubacteriales bacterium]|nr:CotH kinase family protein [Eubacteriales bacterium]